jgi:YebC/PmpR family DNA-binding regulatory protein
VLCEILTDNRNRTAGEIRKVFEQHGGNLGTTGCVAWMFDRQGLFRIASGNVSEDRLMEVALEAGASDVREVDGVFEVQCTPDVFQAVAAALEAAQVPVESSELARVASNTVDLDAEAARTAVKLMEALDDHDDVQSVTSNFNVPDELLAELSAD